MICYSFHCSSAQKLPYGGASVFVKSRIKITVECQKTLNRYWYAGRVRHSVLKGPLDLSPKFFRFAQNLDTRVQIPTTQNIIKSRKTQKRSTAFWYAGRDSEDCAVATKQSPGLFLPNLLLAVLAKFGASCRGFESIVHGIKITGRYQKISTCYWYAGRDSNPRPSGS